MRLLRWRAAVMLIGGGLVFAWVVLSGRTRHTIQIDFGWHVEALTGALVQIDDSVVGTLEPYGRGNHVTGFRVEPGDHVVTVLHDECSSLPEEVSIGGDAGRLIILVADINDGYDCRVVLR